MGGGEANSVLQSTAFSEEQQNQFERVASPDSVPISFNPKSAEKNGSRRHSIFCILFFRKKYDGISCESSAYLHEMSSTFEKKNTKQSK